MSTRLKSMQEIEDELGLGFTEHIDQGGQSIPVLAKALKTKQQVEEDNAASDKAAREAQKTTKHRLDELTKQKREEAAKRKADILHTQHVIEQSVKVSDSIGSIFKDVFGKGKAKLESLPTPGNILLPLTILLILFMVLLPINGHTRLMWLWLALTNNAQIGNALIPPTANPLAGLSATNSVGTATSKNPNQVGTTTQAQKMQSQQTKAKSGSSQHAQALKSTHVTHQTKTSVTAVKKSNHGTGGGPDSYGAIDPTAPIAQMSYSHLLESNYTL